MSPLNSAPHPCAQCAFYKDSLWQPLELSNISVLSRGFSRRDYSVGETVFQQGAENAGIFCVSRGIFAVRAHSEDGNSTLLKLAYPGEIIGFRSFMTETPHTTEAQALVPSRVCRVAHRDAQRVVHGNAKVLLRLASRCVEEVEVGRARIIGAATTPNKDRLWELLKKFIGMHGEADGEYMRMQLPLSRADIAELLGVQPETISRLFKRLKDDGRIVVSGRSVCIQRSALGLDAATNIRWQRFG